MVTANTAPRENIWPTRHVTRIETTICRVDAAMTAIHTTDSPPNRTSAVFFLQTICNCIDKLEIRARFA